MKTCQFKEKDRVKPIIGKKTSNNVTLKNLIELEIITMYPRNYGKIEMRVKIIEGFATNPYKYYRKDDILCIYDDAVELCSPKEPEYDIY